MAFNRTFISVRRVASDVILRETDRDLAVDRSSVLEHKATYLQMAAGMAFNRAPSESLQVVSGSQPGASESCCAHCLWRMPVSSSDSESICSGRLLLSSCVRLQVAAECFSHNVCAIVLAFEDSEVELNVAGSDVASHQVQPERT